MRASNRLSLAVGLCIALTSSACSDSSGTSDGSALRVTLSGDQTGQFVVSRQGSDADPFSLIGAGREVLGRYVIAAEGSTPETVELVAMRPAANGSVDILLMWGPARTGATAMSESFAVVIALGVPVRTDGDLEWVAAESAYTIDEGTITVQQVSGDRYQGTFSGTGYEWRSSAQIRMLNGTFDIRGQGTGGVTESLCRITGRC
jgi:hypothetical protein